MAAIRPPSLLATPAKTLKATSLKASVTSVSSSVTRKSGLSEPKRLHGFGVGHAREVIGQVNVNRFLEYGKNQLFESSAMISASAHERGFNIDLGEFRLAISTQSLRRGSI
jgi:hypothetical protein